MVNFCMLTTKAYTLYYSLLSFDVVVYTCTLHMKTTMVFLIHLVSGGRSSLLTSLVLILLLQDLPLWQRLLGVLVVGKLALWRYITVWLFAVKFCIVPCWWPWLFFLTMHNFWCFQEGACIVTGIGFKEVSSNGNVDWSAVNNVHVWRAETSLTLQVFFCFNRELDNHLCWRVNSHVTRKRCQHLP